MKNNMMKSLVNGITTIAGVKVVNTTPHAVTMCNADLSVIATVDPCGSLINATAVATPVDSNISGVKYQKTGFNADPDTMKVLQDFKDCYPDVVIIGSLIAAQAYPGIVAAMVAHPDFMRVAPQDKKMLIDTYTIY